MSARDHHARGASPICPACGSYAIGRMLVAQAHMDACVCDACGEQWDEDTQSRERRGRSDRASVLLTTRRR